MLQHKEDKKLISLLNLEPGSRANIRHLEGGHAFLSRMAALGFTPGTPIQVIRNTHHGPLLIMVRGSQVAIGREEATRVFVNPSEPDGQNSQPITVQERAVIALAGQPNVGKSTVFNLLTGLNQHVGNWPGKTVEQRVGECNFGGRNLLFIDLPGTYSLTASSEEERIARDFILKEHPDLVIAVVDAAKLERSLYLVAELVLLPAPVLLALNMVDVAEQEGIHIEAKVLESALGIPVVPMAAAHNQGLDQLLSTANRMLDGELTTKPTRPSILPAHQMILTELRTLIEGHVPSPYPVDWTALKLLEGDDELINLIKNHLPPEKWEKVGKLLYDHEDAVLDIAGARYEWIARMIRAAVVEPQVTKAGLTSRLDRYLTHPSIGSIVLMVVLGIVFWLTYTIGAPIQEWLSGQVDVFAESIRTWMSGAPDWIIELFASGVLGGLGMVLTFLPILAIFYFSLGFLEDTGYLARAAYLTDRWMHMMGLHGKSFLPILLGFGCNVPAVLGTRIIESKRARLLTILLIPLIPCTARLAVVTILVPLFFPTSAALVAWGLVTGNLLLLLALGLILHRFLFANEHVAFIMELPLYHLPNLKTIGLYVWQNLLGFLQKAGTVILAATLVIWVFSYFPTGDVMTSYLSWIGQVLAPIGQLMGLPWTLMLAIITSFVAKENTIATLGIIFGNINEVLPALITTPAALAFLVFQMLFIPCVATVATIKQETRSIRWTLLSLGLMLGLSLGIGVLVYQLGNLIMG